MSGGFDVFQLMNGLETCHVTSDEKHYSSFVCGICQKLVSLDCVVTSRCNHVFCRRCLEGHVITQTFLQPTADTNSRCTCPKCQTDLSSDSAVGTMAVASILVAAKSLQESQPVAFQVLKLVQVRCIQHGARCRWTGEYGAHIKHMTSHVGDSQQQQLPAQYSQQNKANTVSASPSPKESDSGREQDKGLLSQTDSKSKTKIRGGKIRTSSTEKAHFPDTSKDEADIVTDISVAFNVPKEIIVERRRTTDSNHSGSISTLHFDDDFNDSNTKSLTQASQSGDTNRTYGGEQQTPSSPKLKVSLTRIPQSSVILEGDENQGSTSFYTPDVCGDHNNQDVTASEKKSITPRTLETEAESQDLHESQRRTCSPQSPTDSEEGSDFAKQVSSRWNDPVTKLSLKEHERQLTRNSSFSSNSYKQQNHANPGHSKKQEPFSFSPSLRKNKDVEDHTGIIEYYMDSVEIRTPHRTKKENWSSINSLGFWDGNGEEDTLPDISPRSSRDEDSDLMAEEEKYNLIIERADKLKKQANAKFNKDRFDEARVLYTESIDLMSKVRPHTSDDFKQLSNMHSNRAVTYFRERQYYECIEDCDKALGYEPTYDKSWIRKWRALMAIGKFDEAYSCLEEANAKIPFSKKIISEFKRIKSDKHIIGEAQELYNKGELTAGKFYLRKYVVACDNIAMLCLAARIDVGLGDNIEGLEKIKKALQINPLQEDANELLGFAHFASGDSETGLSLLSDAFNKNKDSRVLMAAVSRFRKARDALIQGRSEFKKNMYESAAEKFSVAIKESMPLPPLCSMFALLRKERAEAYMLSKNFIQALKDCQEVMSVQPTYVPIYLLRSEILILLGKAEEAKQGLRTAKKTWGADDPYIDDGYYRADFETRIIHVNSDISKLMKNLEAGTFDIDNPLADEKPQVSPGRKNGPRTPKPKSKGRRTTLSHIESRGFGADNVPFNRPPIEEFKKSKDTRRNKSSDRSSDDMGISKSYGQKYSDGEASIIIVPQSPSPSLGRRRDKKRDDHDHKKSSYRSSDESVAGSMASNSKRRDRDRVKQGSSPPKGGRGPVQRTRSESGDKFLTNKRRS